ncbi:hypothetical protein D3C78_883460 [compost metagenome]
MGANAQGQHAVEEAVVDMATVDPGGATEVVVTAFAGVEVAQVGLEGDAFGQGGVV